MSEMRRAARALVESRVERFVSRHDAASSRERLAQALARAGLSPGPTFEAHWLPEEANVTLEARFLPARRTLASLRGLSVGMALLVAASAWVLTQTQEGALRFLLPMLTVLAVLGLPFVVLGLASARAARESRIRRVIRAALQDEEARFPARQE